MNMSVRFCSNRNYHPRCGVVMFSGHLSICLYVCNTITFESLDVRSKLIFGRQLHLQRRRVKLVYEGHRVKVKVIKAKKRKIPHSRNLKL